MLVRENYLKKIRDFYEQTSLIKVIYGLRRSGKSVILTQIMDEIIAKKTDKSHIIYINFEALEYSFIKNAKDLNDYIKSLVKDKKIYYVFLDELQKVVDFEKGINSLRITNQFSIFITGSNSRMTFQELSTDLSGRYVSFRISPLSFKEIVEYTKTPKRDYKKLLFDIFEWGVLPQRFSFHSDSAKSNYITDVYDSIILRDVVERLGVKDIVSFNKVLQYVLETEGKEFSSNNVLEYLNREHHEIATDTLYNYLEALCSTFIMNRVYRYDIQGKNILKTLNKYYASDLGVKKIKTNSKEINYSISMENIVFNELLNKGYEVYIGKTKKGEIDFVATKDKQFKYIQVCYMLSTKETIEREFGAYKNIQDSYEKYVISLDEEELSRDGIKHINLFDFLMNEDF